MEESKEKLAISISFAAIDPYIEVKEILPDETRAGRNGMIWWGTGNIYPYMLYSLYCKVPTLASIIEGTTNFIVGDLVEIRQFGINAFSEVNKSGDTVTDLVRELARDYLIYGGFAIQVIRNKNGEIAELYWIDMRYIRSNKDNSVFFYSENWNKTGCKKVQIYPQFMQNLEWERLDGESRAKSVSSIFFFKENRRAVYPTPIYIQSLKACEIERCIDEYHLNAISNGFSDGAIVNFNNGVPSDAIKKEIERQFVEKFSGHQNAGRIMFSWNPNKDNRTDIIIPQIRDYGEKYNTLAKRSSQQIFTAFRANPNLFGIPTENNGFSNEEYLESFELYNKTQVSPIQRRIKDSISKIFANPDILSITPFSLQITGRQA